MNIREMKKGDKFIGNVILLRSGFGHHRSKDKVHQIGSMYNEHVELDGVLFKYSDVTVLEVLSI